MTEVRSLSSLKTFFYKKNFEYFDIYCSLHRKHQTEALATIRASDKGQIISPCGTGKTRIQASLLVEEMINLNKNFEYGVFVIASHRLSLNIQLLDQVVDFAVKCGLPFDVLYIGSYKCNLNKYYGKYYYLGYTSKVSRNLASTNHKEIETFVQKSRDDFRHVIIASTYDSFTALKNINPINIITYDEAHNTTQDDFKRNILEVKPNICREYFFTATRKVAGEDGGMNDKNFYGNILFDADPKSMLEAGEISCPRLHIIKNRDGKTTDTENTLMLIKNTIEAYQQHRSFLKDVSFSPEDIGAKLLVGCNSIEEMERIYFDLITKKHFHAIQAFAISSNGAYVNWEPCSKEEFFIKLNALSDSEDAIIFNVDMLTEGIDLPSITGVMPLRNLGLTKLIQLLGRALRLHKMDRNRLYKKEISPEQYKLYVKPYGYFIVPEHLSSIDHYPDMIKIAKEFYSQYGTKYDQLIINEKFIDHQAAQLNSIIPFHFRGNKDYDLNHEELDLISRCNLSTFHDIMSKLNSIEKEKYLRDM